MLRFPRPGSLALVGALGGGAVYYMQSGKSTSSSSSAAAASQRVVDTAQPLKPSNVADTKDHQRGEKSTPQQQQQQQQQQEQKKKSATAGGGSGGTEKKSASETWQGLIGTGGPTAKKHAEIYGHDPRDTKLYSASPDVGGKRHESKAKPDGPA